MGDHTTLVQSTRTDPLNFPLSTPKHFNIHKYSHARYPPTFPELCQTNTDKNSLHRHSQTHLTTHSQTLTHLGTRLAITLKDKIFSIYPFELPKYKTSPHGHYKNHWVNPYFALFSSVREKLQTVSLNHPGLLLAKAFSLKI